ncbi:MAG: family 78 glycoside hydrolase catalytic domain [Candidatus Aminicenantes bacterium]|nr:family 78 glycoside hydrolase catalytic domain [Candidatus Aminicenantes bacterium]
MSNPAHLKAAAIAGLIFLAFAAVRAAGSEAAPQAPTGLRLEYMTDPLGVDVRLPRFYWTPRPAVRGEGQSAYQILVSRDALCAKGDIWDSGKIASTAFVHVVYGGKPLASATSYFWKIRSWDTSGAAGPWSEVARFDTGLFEKADWKGAWIGGGGLLRKELTLAASVVRARAYVAGLGYHELRVNGRKAGDGVLEPGWTTYDKRVLYVTYDLTSLLRSGANAVGVMLGQGWYKNRGLLLRLDVETADGGRVSLVSDASWKAAPGPITADSLYNGEAYDARLETPGWDEPGFSDKGWKAAAAIEGPKGVLSAQMMPAIRVMDTIVPFKMTNPKPGVYVFDMGQNFSGWARLRVSGPCGAAVRLRFAELTYGNGLINQENLRSARAEDVYTLKGEGEETYEPRFTYHGFRYVEMTGFPGVPTAETLRGRVVHSGVGQTGSFSCSKPILNSLQRIITWGQKTNLHSVPTDCDQRDERMGWMGDAQGTAEEAIMNFDMAAFYTNFLRDIRDVQDEQGRITDTVPHIWGSRPADPAWGTAYPLIAWYMYQYYGDKRILEEHYDGLKAYVEFLRGKAENGLVKYSYYGDWVAVDKTPGAIVSSFYYYYDVRVLADIAAALKRDAEARSYGELAASIKEAFQAEYFDPKSKNYANGTQTANALALFLELAPEAERGAVWGNLFDNIAYKNDSHLTTGIIGTKYIMEVLNRFGAADLAYDIAAQTSYPSWGYMIENGATTLWELWQKREGPSMNSHNHPMFGSVGAWLYKTLTGLNRAPDTVGFEKILIAPQMVRDLTHASGSIGTVRGRLTSSWSKSAKSIAIEVEIPCGSEAEIVLPRGTLRDVVLKEGGVVIWAGKKAAGTAAGVRSVEEVDKDNLVRIKAGSGRYAFELNGD